jgi:hydrogenase maturation protease
MEETIRLVGIGQPAAGDDGVGIAVVRAVGEHSWSKKLEIHETSDPLRLFEWMHQRCRIILVDAVIGKGQRGAVAWLSLEDLAGGSVYPVSSHGINVAQVLELGRVLAPRPAKPRISIIAVTIHVPSGQSYGLSSEVAAAVPKAVDLIRNFVAGGPQTDVGRSIGF